jgi:LysM repeat protein
MGDNLSKIAADKGTTVEKLLELNPQYKKNPNLSSFVIKSGICIFY